MGEAMACRLRPTWLLALLCTVVASAPTDLPAVDDGTLDDLGLDEIQDPNLDGELYHGDSNHMSSTDVKDAAKVFDVLYPSDDDGDLGESDGTGSMSMAAKEDAIDEARK